MLKTEVQMIPVHLGDEDMNNMEELRQVLHELVTPHLESIMAKLDALEKEMSASFSLMEERSCLRHEKMMARIAMNHAEVVNMLKARNANEALWTLDTSEPSVH